MSSLGAVPGFAFPAFSYERAEFYQNVVPGLTNPGTQNILEVIAAGDSGGAVLVRNVFCTLGTSAAVATRIGNVNVLDGDNRTVSVWSNPFTVPAATTVNWVWDSELATQYTVGTTGYSPLQNIVLVPGWKLQLVVFPAQLSDVLSAVEVVGLRIPQASNELPAAPAIPHPLLV